MTPRLQRWPALVALVAGGIACASAQTPAAPGAAATGKPAPNAAQSASIGPLAPLAWLSGCWGGNVNQRDFREEWLPLTGDKLIGVSQTAMKGKTVDFEYLRLEQRPEGIFYVAASWGGKETAFRLQAETTAKDGDEVFTFANATPGVDYPQRIVYRRGSEGWLYATVEGKVRGADKQVIYPMRRVDCKTGAIAPN
ncbi:MAG TPA: DUF6265 family protein [Casimicrobiaceae bacterium]|nr:DUF6265 family protein [Casimicrobiaceae bacterium]